MNDTLKAVGNIGAELAAAKADLQREMEGHRKTWRQLEQVTGLLRMATDRWESWASEIIHTTPEYESELAEIARVRAALSQQAEPAHKEGFHNCRVIGDETVGIRVTAEPAPAQDEREAIHLAFEHKLREVNMPAYGEHRGDWRTLTREETADVVLELLRTRPAQTEQQPVEVMQFQLKHPDTGDSHAVVLTRQEVADGMEDALYEKLSPLVCDCNGDADHECGEYIYEFELVNAAPIAQTEQRDTEGAMFDKWMQNPYTKVLMDSIEKDYSPKSELDALKAQRGEAVAEVIWYEPDMGLVRGRPGYPDIDCDEAWLSSAPIGTKLYTAPPATDALVEALIGAVEKIVHDDRVPNEVSQEFAEVLILARRASQRKEG